MLATLAPQPFDDPDWVFQPKLDGMRTLAYVAGGEVRLHSRRMRDITAQYPEITRELQTLDQELILDGEIVALDETGKPSFQRLQHRIGLTTGARIAEAEPVTYFVFDVLHAGRDVRSLPWEERQEILAACLPSGDVVRLVPSFPEHGEQVLQTCLDLGFEGVVAKKKGSAYESGKRSPAWRKIKPAVEESFLVGGYTVGTARDRERTLGALLLGRRRDDGSLEYMGHTGIGLDEETLAEIRVRLDDITQAESPFSPRPSLHGRGKPVWTQPRYVAEVRYAYLTEKQGKLREPVFLSLRPVEEPERELIVGPEQREGAVEPTLADQFRHATRNEVTLQVDGQEMLFTGLNRHLWGPGGPRKRDLLAYFASVSPWLLPHLMHRPLMLVRFPGGLDKPKIRTKAVSDLDIPVPDYVSTTPVHSETKGTRPYVVCDSRQTLLWLAEVYNLELHVWLSRATRHPDALHLPEHGGEERGPLNYPDAILFDVDPYIYSGAEGQGAEPEFNSDAWKAACKVARELKRLLDDLGLPALVKTSGKTGLHVVVPIRRRLDFHAVRLVSRGIATHLARHNEQITLAWSIAERAGKIFMDANQNTYGKTMASIYSPRAIAGAWVSMPVAWEDLDSVHPADFTLESVPGLLRLGGDLWENFLRDKVEVIEVLGRLGGSVDG
jgi:bifunctional non-homologous end joining protein LigD